MHVSLLTEIYVVVATIYLRLMEQFFLPCSLEKLGYGFSWVELCVILFSYSGNR